MTYHQFPMKTGIVLGILIHTLISNPSPLSAEVPSAAISPSAIRGVKWTPVDEAKGGDLSYDTGGLSSDQFLDMLHDKGINSIVMKVVDIDNQIPDSMGSDAQKIAMRDAEIARSLKALKNHSKEWHVFLWKREWLQKSGRDLNKQEFERDISKIINNAKSGSYDSIIEGIMPIETNLDNTESVLRYSVELSYNINAATNGWLKKKTFLFPGAGMGAYFKDIDNAWKRVSLSKRIPKESDFFATISKQTKCFSFVVKNMPSQPGKVCSLAQYSSSFIQGKSMLKGWDELNADKNAGYATFAEASSARAQFLNETMGFKDLVNFLKGSDYQTYKNVIYWGDANEGMTANTRSMWFHQTWHQLMVKEQSYKGHFTYYPVLNESGHVRDEFHLRKFLFQTKSLNGSKELIDRGSGWANWKGWSNPDYTIVPTTSSN